VLCLHYLSLFNLAGELSKSKAKISEHTDQVRDILLAVKGSTGESELLCLTRDLRPKAVKTCKWTEKESTTTCFVRLFDDLTELTLNEDSKVEFDTRRAFKVICTQNSGTLLLNSMACSKNWHATRAKK